MHSHQCNYDCASHCNGEYLKVGGTFGATQGMGHFSLTLCVCGYLQGRIGDRFADSKVQIFSVCPVVWMYRRTSAHWTVWPRSSVRAAGAV
jgi:hypothetical protein